MKRILIPIISLFAVTTTVALQSGDFTYTVNGALVTITGFTGSDATVIIPETIDELPVTAIGFFAFYNHTDLTGITIPNSVLSIKGGAFASCKSLSSITIPRSVSSIGIQVFDGCTNLNAIVVDSLNSFYCSLDGVLFNKDQAKLVAYPGGKSGNYKIKSSVTSVESGAFAGCHNLDYIAIPRSVTNIGYFAFNSCSSLETISVEAENQAYSSMNGVLFNKSQTKLISYPDGKVGSSYTIPDGVISIGSGAFDDCINLINIIVSDGVTTVGGDAFRSCSSLTSISLPNSITDIAGGAFLFCSNLMYITVPDGITVIDYDTFGGCSSLSGIYCHGDAPTLISNSAFSGVTNGTVYYNPKTSGWGPTYGDLPTVAWNPEIQTEEESFGVKSNGFSFNISGTNNMLVVVEASTNLANGAWTPIKTNSISNMVNFNDTKWTNHTHRFYRLSMP